MACGVPDAAFPLVRPGAIGSAAGIVRRCWQCGCSSRGFSFQVEKIVERKRVFLSGTVRSGLRVLRSAAAVSWGGKILVELLRARQRSAHDPQTEGCFSYSVGRLLVRFLWRTAAACSEASLTKSPIFGCDGSMSAEISRRASSSDVTGPIDPINA